MVNELEQRFSQWSPAAQAEAAALLDSHMREPALIWYCPLGRKCDGKPHDGVPYSHARADQWPPTMRNWFIWLVMSGRGAGKTRTGSEYLRKSSARHSRMAGIARRTTDIRMTMVEGDSGLIRTCEKAKVGYDWKPTKREFTFDNGSTIYFYSAEEPDSLRGPQHELAWLDEPAHMPLIQDVWDNLLLGLRIGPNPRVLMTSTPLPIPWLKTILKRDDVALVRVSTYANLDNLAPIFRKAVLDRYEGTRLGRQELYGELVEDVEGALWNAEIINLAKQLPPLFETEELLTDIPWERIVVGVDPAGTANKRSDATGIVVVGRLKGIFYVLEDATGKYSPDGWAKKVASLYKKWSADRIVVEKNYGGDLVEANLRNEDEYLPITTVTSRKGKDIRAEPIVGLYEKGKVKHAADVQSMETEMLEWVPGSGPSPNRIDAVVHALTDMMGKSGHSSLASAADEIIPMAPMSPIPTFINQTKTGLWLP